MPDISKSTRVCETCGSPVETTSSDDFGCMVCLFDAVLAPGPEESEVAFASAPDQLGAYTIEHRADGSVWELGHGAMGVTFRAIDKVLDRRVALKIINTDLGSRSAEARERFMREARAAAALRHPNVATVYQFGVREETGQFFYAMELIEGETLEERVHRTGPLDVRTTLNIAQQVTAALAAAEKHGLIHRDLKPANLMLVSPDEETSNDDGNSGKLVVKIIDFGVAKAINAPTDPMRLTRGGFVGTPAFASPEQFENTALDVRSDIYSLGATLWFALTGKTPFPGHSVEEIRHDQESNTLPVEQLKAARVQPRLRSLLKSMLAAEPAARPGTRDLAAQLHFCAAQASGARRVRVAIAAAAILILGASAFFISRSPRTQPAAPERSVAVLPFENLSRDPDSAFFADGIQGEILARLSKIHDLKVISRTSTLHFQSSKRNLPEIARRLGVASILEGTVQKTEDQVRVNVQLINARNDSQLWAERYDRRLTDVFSMESEIAKAIADTLGAKLRYLERRAIVTRPTENTEAHLLHLKGTYFSNKRTAPDLRTAIGYFKAAIGKDPNYALAHAGLADAYALLSLWGGEGPHQTVREAKAAVRKALELDESLPEAHNSLGVLLALHDFDFAESKKEFERALELDPNYATAHHQFANLNLSMVGDFDRAIAEGNRAVELDPLSLIINADLGQDFMLARRYDEAIDQLRRTLEMEPRFYYARWTLGEALQMKGQLREAIAEYEKATETSDDPIVLAMLAQGYARNGQRDRASNLLSQLEQMAGHRYVGPFAFALAHVALGEIDKAIDLLEQAYHERDPRIVGIKVEPLLDPLRGHPRFERLVTNITGAKGNKSPGSR
jgi:eukaryotic-like serine/threonine-protein kinase